MATFQPRSALLFTLLALAAPAWAQQDDATPAGQPATGFWDRPNLFGDPGGVRSRLAAKGVTFGLLETAEVLGNPTGGTRQAVVFEGLLQLGLGIDTQKAFGLPGGTFNVSAYQIHGRGLSQNALANNLMTVSSLEAERGFLLFELWYEQQFFGDKLGVRIGQMAADQEFMTSQYAGLFVNHTFGWSTFPSVNLPSGGPAYPLATPGVRVRVRPTDELTGLAGVFNGDPSGPGPGTPQSRNPSGTAFRLKDNVLALLEVQYAINQAEGATGLPGTYKLGAYYHGGSFADQRRNAAGLSLADPDAEGTDPRGRRRNYGLYAVADQLVWRPQGAKEGGLGVFARIMGGPGDRNLVNVYMDAGVTYKGIVPSRPDDTAGLAFGYARFSDTAGKLDSDTARFSGTRVPIRRNETVLELTYQAQLAPWWQVQPTAQYVFNINGGTLDPTRPGKRIGDALVLGLRTAVTF